MQFQSEILELDPRDRRRGNLAAPIRLIAVGLAIAALLIPIVVLAVHDLDLFELDRNATDEALGGEDWATLYDGGANTGGNSADFTGIIADVAPLNPLGS